MPNELEEQSEEVVEQTEEQTEEQEQADYDKVFYGEEDEDEGEAEHTEEELEADGQDPDEDVSESEDDGDAESNGEEEGEPTEQRMLKLKWKGKIVEVTEEEAIAMAQQGFDATNKYQEVARMRKQAERELELIERVKKGDKDALAQLAKDGNIDPLDLLDVDMDGIEQGTSDQEEPFVSPEVDVLMKEVAKDERLFDALSDIERSLPTPVVEAMAKDVDTFYTIVNEVRSGDAEIVMPQVQARLATLDDVDKAVVMNNKDAFANFYLNVKQSMIEANQPQDEAPTQPKKKVNRTGVSIQKSKTTKRSGAGKLDSFQSDEAYQKILERLNSQT